MVRMRQARDEASSSVLYTLNLSETFIRIKNRYPVTKASILIHHTIELMYRDTQFCVPVYMGISKPNCYTSLTNCEV